MIDLHTVRTGGRIVRVVASERSDGDMNPRRVPPDLLADRQRRLIGSTWAMLDQVHGTHVVTAHRRGDPPPAHYPVGDVTVAPPGGPPVAVWAADCAPLVLVRSDATIVMIHAGWRGLAAGIIDAGVDAGGPTSTEVVSAVLGPVIHACCYEFSTADIACVARGVGADPSRLTGRTTWGAPALDVPAAVGTALEQRGIRLDVTGPCTGCDSRWFSHRRRSELGRHAVVAWSEP